MRPRNLSGLAPALAAVVGVAEPDRRFGIGALLTIQKPARGHVACRMRAYGRRRQGLAENAYPCGPGCEAARRGRVSMSRLRSGPD
jgi:hypothetical protein